MVSLPNQKEPLLYKTYALHERSEKEKSDREYQVLMAAFTSLLDQWDNSAGRWEAIEDIINHRAAFLVDRILTGLELDFDQALTMLRDFNTFTTARQRSQRDILVAAIDNLVEFAAAQQYAMVSELPEDLEQGCIEQYNEVCRRYNLVWASRENEDALHAALVAAQWIGISSDTILTYMTQGDERVRPWHEELEGISYPKNQFPSELIPPIEYGCRCYLVAEGMGAVVGSLTQVTTPAVHPVFRESLCTGGRIFSLEHPYFRISQPPQLQAIIRRIKLKFHL